MGSLVVAFIVFLTAVTVVVIGILTAYGIVAGILYAFAYHSQRNQRTQVLVPSQTPASGD